MYVCAWGGGGRRVKGNRGEILVVTDFITTT